MGKWRMQRRTWELPALSRPQRTGPYQQGQDFPRHSRRNGGTMGRARDYLIFHPSAVCGGQFYLERTEHMAVNKITHSWNNDYTGLIFTGSQRQPTLVEVRNYCVAQHIPLEGVYITAVRLGGEWTPPEDAKSIEIFEFGENCPVCGKAFVLDTDICPICHKRWDS